MMPVETISDNIKRVRDVIANSCARVGRDPDSVTLVAISKTKPVSAILEAIDSGIVHFGENRVEEAEIKIPQFRPQHSHVIQWHMIGHIQSRKAKHIPELFDKVHSVDRYKLAQKLDEVTTTRLPVLLEVNISGEDSKHGLNALDWEHNSQVRDTLVQEVQSIVELTHLDVRGLMTMAPYYAIPEDTRPVFASLVALRDHLQSVLAIQLPELSMGMTNDYAIAIEEGSTIIRVGRAIFGER